MVFSRTIYILSFFVLACSSTKASKLTTPEVTERLESQRPKAEIKKTRPKKSPQTAKERAINHIEQAVKAYHEQEAIQMKVDKKVKVAMLDRVTHSKGQMFFSKGLLRLEISEPEKSIIILNKENLWLINYLPEDLGGGIQIGRMSAKKASQKQRSPVAFLLQDTRVFEDFRLAQVVRSDGVSHYALKPNRGKGWQNLKSLTLKINKSNEILEVAYWDNLDNETRYTFSEFKVGEIKNKSAFTFSPPAGAEVVEY